MQPLLLVLVVIISPGSDPFVPVLYTDLSVYLEAHLESIPLKTFFSNSDMAQYFD